jgi:hypothetical protein
LDFIKKYKYPEDYVMRGSGNNFFDLLGLPKRIKEFDQLAKTLILREITKAFFPKRTDKKPRIVRFVKSISVGDLLKRGVDIRVLIKELEVAHKRNTTVKS